MAAKCPFHEERTPSFMVWPDGRSTRFGSCNASGDVIDAFARFERISLTDAARRLAESAPGVLPAVTIPPVETRIRTKPKLPPLRRPITGELHRLGLLRSITVEALRLAVNRGFLWMYDDSREGGAWILTDQARWLAIARRLDGQTWQYRGREFIENPEERPKSKNLYGSRGNWPIGIVEAHAYPAIALAEGAPDFLSVLTHAWASGIEHQIAPVCLSGASVCLPDEVLPLFAGKCVRIFADDDPSGYGGAVRWYDRLRPFADRIDVYGFEGLTRTGGQKVKDLNDLLEVNADCWEENRPVIESLMNFSGKEIA
jgi:hypothetical protein